MLWYQPYLDWTFQFLGLVIMALVPVLLSSAISHIKDQKIRAWVELLVRCAEQTIPDNGAKYDFVREELARRYKIKDTDADILIQATVQALKTPAVVAPAVPPTAQITVVQPPATSQN